MKCITNGGRPSQWLIVTGSDGYFSTVMREPVGNLSWRGNDTYSATTDNISTGNDGDMYKCTSNNVNDISGSVILRGKICVLHE